MGRTITAPAGNDPRTVRFAFVSCQDPNATVRVTPDQLETEFVAIPRPVERSGRADGGPIGYRVVHRVKLWKAGEAPQMEQQVIEGTPPLAM